MPNEANTPPHDELLRAWYKRQAEWTRRLDELENPCGEVPLARDWTAARDQIAAPLGERLMHIHRETRPWGEIEPPTIRPRPMREIHPLDPMPGIQRIRELEAELARERLGHQVLRDGLNQQLDNLRSDLQRAHLDIARLRGRLITSENLRIQHIQRYNQLVADLQLMEHILGEPQEIHGMLDAEAFFGWLTRMYDLFTQDPVQDLPVIEEALHDAA